MSFSSSGPDITYCWPSLTIIFRFVLQTFKFLTYVTYVPNNSLHPGPGPFSPEVPGVSHVRSVFAVNPDATAVGTVLV